MARALALAACLSLALAEDSSDYDTYTGAGKCGSLSYSGEAYDELFTTTVTGSSADECGSLCEASLGDSLVSVSASYVLLWINPDYADDDDVEEESFDIDEESIEEEEISYADKVAVVPALCWLGYRVQQWHPEIAAGDVDTVGVVLTVFTGSLALENDDDYAYDFVVDSEGWCRRGTLRWKMHPALGPAT